MFQQKSGGKTKSGATKHAVSCAMAFGRKDPTCPRCQELLAGAAPRSLGFDPNRKAELDAAHAASVRAHKCDAAGCGPVCTFGDW